MTDNQSSSISVTSNEFPPPQLQFWLFLILEIPSIACYILIFIYIIFNKSQRQALHNHCILIILFLGLGIVLFDVSFVLDFIRRGGQVYPAVPIFCQVWWVFDFGFVSTLAIFLAWLSFERHILVFYPTQLGTRKKRIVLHYLPMTIIMTYCVSFYSYVIFWPPCDNYYDFTLSECGGYPCFNYDPFLSVWNLVVNLIVPILLVTILNVALIVRVIWQKSRLNRHPDWKKYRRMIFQLLSIAFLYVSVLLPAGIIGMVELCGLREWGVDAQIYLYFFSYLQPLLLPFVCLASYPEVMTKLKLLVGLRHPMISPTVADTAMTMRTFTVQQSRQ